MSTFPSPRVPVWARILTVSAVTVTVCIAATTGQASASEKSRDHGKNSAPGQVKRVPATTTTVKPNAFKTPTTVAPGVAAQPAPNGNGKGAATGKPCAGCVGNADDKTPKGQAADGSDKNKGYECDKNKGVGKGNPAHSSCSPSVGAASTPRDTTTSTSVKPSPSPSTTIAPAEVLSETVTKPEPAKLALTGSSSTSTATLASALLLIGSLLVLAAAITRNYRMPFANHLRQ